MLQLKSFKMADEKGMNELLTGSIIAKGSSVYVSNGDMIIPVEDGLEPNKAQKTLLIKESQNKLISDQKVHKRAFRVTELRIADVVRQLADRELDLITPKGKKEYDKNQDFKAIVAHLKSIKASLSSELISSKAEIDRISVEIGVCDEELAALEN